MFQRKFCVILTLLFGFLQMCLAGTKILSSLSINHNKDLYRNEIISLDKDQHLLVDGRYNEYYEIPNDPYNRLTVTVVYVADKNGYKAKYVLVKEPYPKPVFLNPSTLKSTAG